MPNLDKRLVQVWGVLILLFSVVPVKGAAQTVLSLQEFTSLQDDIRLKYAQSPQAALAFVDSLYADSNYEFSHDQQIVLKNYQIWFFIEQGRLEEAVQNLVLYKSMLASATYTFLEYGYYNLMGGVLEKLQDYESALTYFQQAHEIAKRENKERFIHQTEGNIAQLYLKLDRCEVALEYFDDYLEYLHHNFKADSQQISLSIARLGRADALACLSEWDSAIAAYQQAVAELKDKGFGYYVADTLTSFAHVYAQTGQTNIAKETLREVLVLAEQQDYKEILIEVLLLLAELDNKAGYSEQARQYLARTQSLIDESISETLLMRFYQAERAFFQQNGEVESALIAADRAAALQIALLEKRAGVNLAMAVAQVDLKAREQKISRLEEVAAWELERSEAYRRQVTIAAIGAILILLISFLAIVSIRRKQAMLIHTLEELRATQHHLIESEKISALSTLVVGMAHQLNTPVGNILTAVTCFSEELDKLRTDFDSKKISVKNMQRFLNQSVDICNVIQKCSDKVADMVTKFKSISASVGDPKPVQIALKGFLSGKLPLMEDYYHIPIRLSGDEIRLETYPDILLKVLYMLLDNSVEHAFDHEPNPVFSIAIRKMDKSVEIECRDNGCGISEEHSKRIFTPFYTTKLGEGKLGLGLNVIYNSVFHSLNGRIRYVPSDVGVSFIISLPL